MVSNLVKKFKEWHKEEFDKASKSDHPCIESFKIGIIEGFILVGSASVLYIFGRSYVKIIDKITRKK